MADINWMQLAIGDILLGIVISAVFVFVQNRQGKQNEQAIEKLLEEKVITLRQDHRLLELKIDAAVEIIEKSVANGQTQGK